MLLAFSIIIVLSNGIANCLHPERDNSTCSDADLKNVVNRLEDVIKHQEEAINKAMLQIHALSDQVKSLQKGFLERGRRQVESVGFTATFDHSQQVHMNNVLKFNVILYNDGNGYNMHTGIFTVPVTGTYLISFQVEDYRTHEMKAFLKVDGRNIVDAIITDDGSDQSGNTVVLRLTTGNSVWIESEDGYVWGDSYFRGTSFCGALLY